MKVISLFHEVSMSLVSLMGWDGKLIGGLVYVSDGRVTWKLLRARALQLTFLGGDGLCVSPMPCSPCLPQGTLIQHLKEHMLHGNMRSSDILLYYTTVCPVTCCPSWAGGTGNGLEQHGVLALTRA